MNRPPRTTVSESSLVLMGVPKKFARYTIDDYIPYEGVAEVKEYVKRDFLGNLAQHLDRGDGIFMCGSNGVGKSMLSCIILKEVYRLRYSCRRVTFSSYIDRYTESWKSHDRKETDTLESDLYGEYKGVDFLVLEEVGKEIDSKIAKPILEDLLRYREEQSLSTVICSNLSPKDFVEYYGNSVRSLVNGSMVLLEIVAKDRRYESDED